MSGTGNFQTVDVPRNCADRQTVPNWQQVRDALNQQSAALIEYSHDVKLRGSANMRPLDTRYGPVGLWSMNIAPGTSVPDLSGNGNTLITESGTLRTSALWPNMGGVYFDGSTVLAVALSVPLLRIQGALSIVVQYSWFDLPTGTNNRTVVSHGALPGAPPATNYQYRWGTDINNQGVYFSQHGATGTFDGANTLSTLPRYQPGLVCVTRTAGGVLTHGLNGVTAGGPFGTVTLPTDGTTTKFRVGGEQGASNCLIGIVGSVGIYNFALSNQQFLDLYNYTMGATFGYRQLATIPDDLQPIFYADRDLQLIDAAFVPDSTSATFAKTSVSFSLYLLDTSGSKLTTTLMATIDGNAASAQNWTAFRGQSMRLAGTRPVVSKGTVLAVTGKSLDWNGDLRLSFRRVVS